MPHTQTRETWSYSRDSGVVKYWVPLAPAGTPLARAEGETRAAWTQRVGVADPINRTIAFDVDGVRINLTARKAVGDCRWMSQIATKALAEKTL